MCVPQQNGAEMDYCRVVGPRGLCRPLDEKQGFPTNTSPLAPCQGCSKAWQSGRARQSRAGHLRTGQGYRDQRRGQQIRGVASSNWPRRFRRYFLDPQNCQKKCGLRKIGGVAPSDRPGRLYPPSPSCRDARPGASVGASSAHANSQQCSRQFRV